MALLKAVAIFGATFLIRQGLGKLSVGVAFENFEFAVVQSALRVRAAVAPISEAEERALPVVVDISEVSLDRTGATDREVLSALVDQLRNLGATVVGLDVDFAPAANGDYVSPADFGLLKRWNGYRNVRVGIFRRIGGCPAEWLGRDEFAPLAAGILRPWRVGYAYQYVDAAVEATADTTPPLCQGAVRLLQMPAALHAVGHPGAASNELGNLPTEPVYARHEVLEAARFPVDFAFLSAIKILRYSASGDLERRRDEIEGHPVLIGDVQSATDSVSSPLSDRPLSGVVAHALALDTLARRPLWFPTHLQSLAFEFVLLVIVVAVSTIRVTSDSPAVYVVHEQADIVSALLATGVVVFVGFGLAVVWRLFWPEFVWVALGFFFEPYLRMLIRVARNVLTGAFRVAYGSEVHRDK